MSPLVHFPPIFNLIRLASSEKTSDYLQKNVSNQISSVQFIKGFSGFRGITVQQPWMDHLAK